jgi:hypothetical protein
MELMLVAARAVLLPLDALRMEPLVLRGEVIAILALVTGENDLVSGHGNFRKRDAQVETRAPLWPQASTNTSLECQS